MATRLGDARAAALRELRYEPTEKRIRARLGDETVLDSTRAVLVWEPRRVLPCYAVPAQDVRGELVLGAGSGGVVGADLPDGEILHGAIPFAVHSSAGEPVGLRLGDAGRELQAFRVADADLSELVLLDFEAFDAWFEEDEQIIAHPRDPFHRVDIRRSSRHVLVELAGTVLADCSRPHLVFETSLPVRFYLPRQDVRVALAPSDKRTRCAYKGEASYWAFSAGGAEHTDLAWSYETPLPDANPVQGLVAFFDERVQVTLDGQRRGGELSGIAATIAAEAKV